MPDAGPSGRRITVIRGVDMRKRRRRGGLSSAAMDIVASGIGLGVGSQAIGQVGGATAAHSQQALANLSGFYPAMGTIAGAGATLKALKKNMKTRR